MRDGFQEMQRSTEELRPQEPPNPAKQVQYQDRDLREYWEQRLEDSSSEEADLELFDYHPQTYRHRMSEPPQPCSSTERLNVYP